MALKKKAKKTASKTTPRKGSDVLRETVKKPNPNFKFGYNKPTPEQKAKIEKALTDPLIKKLSKRKSFSISELPINQRKSFKGLASQLEKNADELNALLGPTDRVAIQFKVHDKGGKSRVNKSLALHGNFTSVADYLKRYELQKRFDQSTLISGLQIVRFSTPVQEKLYQSNIEHERLNKAIKRNASREELKQLRKENKEQRQYISKLESKLGKGGKKGKRK